MTGFFCWGPERPSVTLLKELLLAQTPRGTDASGMAFHEKGVIHILKDAKRPYEFIKNTEEGMWNRLAASHYGLLHARNKTVGSKEHDSNHPVHKWGWVVTHNGTIKNDNDLFKHYGEPRFADVDTAAVPLVLKQGKNYEDSLRQLTLLDGNATMVILKTDEPTKVALARFGIYDLFLFYDYWKKILYWSSLPSVTAYLPGLVIGQVAFTMMSKLPEDRVLVLHPDQEYHTDLYKAVRNPFSIPCTTKSEPKTTGTGGTGVKNQEATSSEALECPYFTGYPNRKIRHIQWGDLVVKERGVPDFLVLEPSLVPYNLGRIRDWMHKQPKDDLVVPTLYGRWFFELTSLGRANLSADLGVSLKRSFKPRKSQKRMLSIYGDGITLPTFRNNLDKKLAFDTFNILEKTNSCTSVILGWACPWCGVALPIVTWEDQNHLCVFCGVISRSPVTHA